MLTVINRAIFPQEFNTKFYWASLEIIDYLIQQCLDALVGLATDFEVGALSLPCRLSQVRTHFPDICFVANDIDRTGAAVVLDLPQPVVDAVDRLLVPQIHEQHQQRGLLVHLVSDLQEIQSSREVPESDVDRGGLEGHEFVDRLNSQSGFVVGGAGETETPRDEGGFASLGIANEADFYLHHFFSGRH